LPSELLPGEFNLGKLLTIRRCVMVLVVLASAGISAFAAERITLSNGFYMDCDHHATVGSHVRLYLSSGENNYIEKLSEDIVNVEIIPDPLLAPKAAEAPGLDSRPFPQNARKWTGHSVSMHDTKLSEADLGEMLTRAGHEHNLDVDLLASLVKAESSGNSRAVSRAGARGLMQLMPATAKDMGVQDSFEPDQNVNGGSAYLDELLTRYHDNLALALAAYNAGPEAVDRYHGIPPYHETRVYVARVIHEFNRRVLAREAEAKRAAAQTRQAAAPAAATGDKPDR